MSRGPLATDPAADAPVAFAVVGRNDAAHMRRFLGNLKAWGFLPRVVLSDGSKLYPAAVAEVWPHASHQLCLFHADADLAGAIRRLKAPEFDKIAGYLDRPDGLRERTNNHVERANRSLRLLEKVRYGWRRRRTLVRFLALKLDEIWGRLPPGLHPDPWWS